MISPQLIPMIRCHLISSYVDFDKCALIDSTSTEDDMTPTFEFVATVNPTDLIPNHTIVMRYMGMIAKADHIQVTKEFLDDVGQTVVEELILENLHESWSEGREKFLRGGVSVDSFAEETPSKHELPLTEVKEAFQNSECQKQLFTYLQEIKNGTNQ